MVDASVLAALKAVEPLRSGKTKAPESKAVQPVAIDHVEACIKVMTPTVAAMVSLQMLTGMRAAELCSMRTCDIESGDPACWIYRPASHKTAHLGKVREIPLGPRAIEVSSPLLRPDVTEFIFSPARADAERRSALAAGRKTPTGHGNGPGTNRRYRPKKSPGTRYDTPTYLQAIAYATARAFPPPPHLARQRGETAAVWRERLGPKLWPEFVALRKSVHLHPRQLRHTFATSVRKQFGLDHAQKSLGHSHAGVTERDAQVAPDNAMEVAKAIG